MKKINVYEVLLYMLWISLFKIAIIPNVINQIIKLFTIIITILFAIKNLRLKEYYSNIVTIFCIIIVVSSFLGYLNNHIRLELVVDSIFYALCIFCTFIMIKYGINNDKEQFIINSLFNVLLIIFIGSLISIAIVGTAPILLLQYFMGNKFLTSYYMILFAVIYAVKYNVPEKKSIKFLILTILVISMCGYIQCSTALLGSVLLLGCYLKKSQIKDFLADKKVLLASLIIASILLIFFSTILETNFVSMVITNILHEDIDLTGRLKIYEYLLEVIKEKPLIGYGYGTDAVAKIVGYGNAQNGLFQLIVQFGLLGGIIFVVLFYNFLKKESESPKKIWPLYIYLYITIICSIVEVSYNYLFFLSLFIIYAYNQKNIKKNLIK